MITRVPIFDVRPQIESGRLSAKTVVGEQFTISARVFAEGPAVRAAVVLTDPDGKDRAPVQMHQLGNDHWAATVQADRLGDWTYRVVSWLDPYATWQRKAARRFAADVDLELTLAEGAQILDRITGATDLAQQLRDSTIDPHLRLALANDFDPGAMLNRGFSPHPSGSNPSSPNPSTLDRYGLEYLGQSPPLGLQVDRERALFGSWYELFIRSEGAERLADGTVRSGTFSTAAQRLAAVAAMGFDVVYLPPINPIGVTGRKGRNNALVAGPDDPGSPWAIGSAAGGHDAIEPVLGTLEDFDAFVARAAELGLEIALDVALQCSPDHPWVRDHPEWFTHRPDGTIAFAENPPKQYQDIYPLDFDSDPEGIYAEVLRIIEFWIARGVRIFRVDNPHTKPLGFWHRLLGEVHERHPEVIFLAEAFTSPAMLQALSAVGFHLSYTYFTWRYGADETASYLSELAHHTSDFLRPLFFVNTPDILPRYLQGAEESMFRMRAVLAATGSPSWGMYAGFELLENQPAGDDTEEYLNSEKYEIKLRDWHGNVPLQGFITRLNQVRREHPALRQLRHLQLHRTDDAAVIAYSKTIDDDTVLMVIDLQPQRERCDGEHMVRIETAPAEVGLSSATEPLRDALDGSSHTLDAVRLSPERPACILVPTGG